MRTYIVSLLKLVAVVTVEECHQVELKMEGAEG